MMLEEMMVNIYKLWFEDEIDFHKIKYNGFCLHKVHT